jgi:hypothetical protein
MSDNKGDEICGICGDVLSSQYCETLVCSHVFHYECIFKTFKVMKQTQHHPNRCPYCRKNTGYLTLVNGLSKLEPKIHYNPKGTKPPYESTRCSRVLVRGPKKGQGCGKKCQVGYDVCKAHKK